ncbi:FAD-dependent oxidoreductase domain-containing protein 1 [Alosa pseudoharengus]|uniref:FAD-dependent oxidoreductase domain-containing protein 1 n=1 Tax=Alosa pseudoharengus TaxID=34774 RepID=UPI003F887202
MSSWQRLISRRHHFQAVSMQAQMVWAYTRIWSHRTRHVSTGVSTRSDFLKSLELHMKNMRKKAAAALPGSNWSPYEMTPGLPPERVDILIVGGGVVGWSIAYWLKRRTKPRDSLRVLVVEKDPTYAQASTVLSAGGIRQQFSLAENIQLSLASADFLKNINDHLGVLNEDPVDLQFNHSGYLFVASEKGVHVMETNYQTQRHAGAKVKLLSPTQLKVMFPWINTDGVALASYGLENEGWFDPWTLLYAFRRKALSMGVEQCFGEVTGFNHRVHSVENKEMGRLHIKRITHANVQMPNSIEFQPVECTVVINAAGANSGKVAEMVGIGFGPQGMVEGTPIPVEPRKRYIYVVHCPHGPGMDTPFLVDYSGVYLRREGLGGNYITGLSPDEVEEPNSTNLDVDHDFFHEKIWPNLAHRVPAFECLKVTSAWAGFYDYNTFDQNGLLGIHHQVRNMYFATGFSGHGLQQSPAIGRAMAELILDGSYQTLNLSALDVKRIFYEEPLLEKNIV